jgi:hypothetical protein
MRDRNTAWLRPGSWSCRWLGLVLLAIPYSRLAAADQPASPEPPVAPAGAPAARSAATPPGHRLALLDVPPAPQQATVAAVLVSAAYAAIQADDRFSLATVEQVAAARAEHGVSATDLTYPDACRVGRAVGASHAILIGGYDLSVHTSEKKSDIKRALGMVAELGNSHGAAHSAPASRYENEARATASVIVMDMASCKVGKQAVIRARRESDVSVDDARSRVRDDFVAAVRQGLQRLFPLHALVRAPRPHGGVISHGSRHGVRDGQYYAVRRAGRVVADVHVDEVEPDSARVSLVRGARRLQPGDRLSERDTMHVWEFGVAATPSVLARREAGDVFGVAASVHSMVSQPVSGNVYGLMVEYLNVSDLQRWRGGVHYARQLRVVPRRLFVHARVGVGLFRANQPLADETGRMYDGATARGIEVLNGLGAKVLLGESLAMQAEVSYPLLLGDDQWALDSDPKKKAPADALTYPLPQRGLPTLTVGVSMRF